MSERKIVTRPAEWFKFDNIRKQFDPEDLVRLGESLKRRQWHPIVAKSDGIVVDGERRVRAAREVGLETLDAIIVDAPMSQTELRLAQGATAMHRADLSGWEKYVLCYELIQLNPGWQAKDLAEHLAIDPSMVTRILSASKAVPEVRAALKAGRLGTTDVYAISKEKSDAGQLELLTAKLNGASRDSIERQAKQKRNGSAPVNKRNRDRSVPVARVSRIRIPVGNVIVTFSGKGMTIDNAVDAGLEAVKKMQADKVKAASVQAIEKDLAAIGN